MHPSDPGRPSGDETPYEGFLSYSSKDAKSVKRIHRFLESLTPRSRPERVRVYLDQTDIRGGELGDELRDALVRSRALIVCWSAAAADSKWVEREIDLFREAHGDRHIALLTLGARGSRIASPKTALDWRLHDLRRAWVLGILTPRARLELLRLLAFLTNVDLRTLRNWHLRRTLRNVALTIGAALIPVAALLSLTLDHWPPVPLQADGRALHAIAADARGNKLWVASRFRGQGPQGFRNYIRTTENAYDPDLPAEFNAPVQLRTRLLPPSTLDRRIAPTFPRASDGRWTGIGPPLIGEPAPGKTLFIQPIALTSDEASDALDLQYDTGIPVPLSKRSLVVAVDRHWRRASIVDGLTPHWPDRTASGDPPSPARGPTVAWLETGDIWLGIAGHESVSPGGLWHSPDGGGTWTQVPDFFNVTSIRVQRVGDGPPELLVAESFIELWHNGLLEPYPARVRRKTLPDGIWSQASTPPFGSRSELELCGTVGGVPIVRVDDTIFEYRPRSMLGALLRGDLP